MCVSPFLSSHIKYMNHDNIPYCNANEWYPWERNKYPVRNKELSSVMLESIRAAILPHGIAASVRLRPLPGDAPRLLSAVFGCEVAPASPHWQRASFNKRKADLLFWSGTALSFLARILIFTDDEHWAEALEAIGLVDRARETATEALGRIGRAVAPVIYEIVAELGEPGTPYHVMRYDEMRERVAGDFSVRYTPDKRELSHVTKIEQHNAMLRTLCDNSLNPTRTFAVLTHTSPWKAELAPLAAHAHAPAKAPPPPSSVSTPLLLPLPPLPALRPYHAYTTPRFDGDGLALLKRLMPRPDDPSFPCEAAAAAVASHVSACVRLCPIYINVTVPSHPANHPRLIDLKIGKSDHGGKSRLGDAHAAHWMTLVDATLALPESFAEEAKRLYPAHFAADHRPSETGERFLHGLLDAFNYRHCLSSQASRTLLQKEHFCMDRPTLRHLVRIVYAMTGGLADRFASYTPDIESRYPPFWAEAAASC